MNRRSTILDSAISFIVSMSSPLSRVPPPSTHHRMVMFILYHGVVGQSLMFAKSRQALLDLRGAASGCIHDSSSFAPLAGMISSSGSIWFVPFV